MKLSNWLSSEDMNLAEFAAKIGAANASVVSKYVNGRRMPRPDVMRKITEVTGGKVTANDFYCSEAA